MANLQELFDFYFMTQPTQGKLRNASRFLTHACCAMEVNRAEEIADEKLLELPAALERYFAARPQQAIQDKGMLAEMIGRFGPRNGWEPVYRLLLNDANQNLRQLTLQAIEYYAAGNLTDALPILEEYRDCSDPLMREVSALVLARLLILPTCRTPLQFKLHDWARAGQQDFIRLLYQTVQNQSQKVRVSKKEKAALILLADWLKTNFGFLHDD